MSDGLSPEVMYEAGESSGYADWDIALDDLLPDDVEPLPTQVAAYVQRLQAESGQKRDAIRRVRDLHERRDSDAGYAYCDVCSNHGDTTWPCATIRALDGK